MSHVEELKKEFAEGLPGPIPVTEEMIREVGLKIVSYDDPAVPKRESSWNTSTRTEVRKGFLGLKKEVTVTRPTVSRYVTDGKEWVGFAPAQTYGELHYSTPAVVNNGKALESSLEWIGSWKGRGQGWAKLLGQKAGLPLVVSQEVSLVLPVMEGIPSCYSFTNAMEAQGAVYLWREWVTPSDLIASLQASVSAVTSGAGLVRMVLVTEEDLRELKVAAYEGDAPLELIEKIEKLLKG